MNYWKLLGTTAILMTALCVGIHFYAKWDLKRFEESLGERYTPASQKIEPTVNLAKQGIPENEMEAAFEKQQETELQMTDTTEEDALLDEFFNELANADLNAHLENPETTDAESDTLADFLQELSDNPSAEDSSLIAIEELDTTQTSGWIELELGDRRLEDITDLKGLGDGSSVIITDTNGNIINSTKSRIVEMRVR